ncbi:MAG: hypothetical protein ACE5EK_05160 [Nitrospinales bacterium]
MDRHDIFKKRYKAGEIKIRVDKDAALKILGSPFTPNRFNLQNWVLLVMGTLGISIASISAFPGDIVASIVLLTLGVGFTIPALWFVLRKLKLNDRIIAYALTWDWFFNKALKSGALVIEEGEHLLWENIRPERPHRNPSPLLVPSNTDYLGLQSLGRIIDTNYEVAMFYRSMNDSRNQFLQSYRIWGRLDLKHFGD